MIQPPEEWLNKSEDSTIEPPKEWLDNNLTIEPPKEWADDSPTKIKDVGTLKQMKDSGQQLTRDQERILFDAEENKPITQKASEAVNAFLPAAWNTAKQLGTGTGEFIYKGILKPIDAMSQSPEEAEKTLKEAGNVIRSGVHGVAQDVQETADAAVRFYMFGSDITDKLLGKSADERFEKYMLRQGMREFSQKVYEDNPDAAARLLAENPILQNLAYAAALAQGGTEEEAQLAKKAYEQLVKEQGLTKEEINENVAMLGEVISPLSLPGTNTATKFLNKGTTKIAQKTGELALKGIVAPIAKGVEKIAGGVQKGIEGTEKLSRKIGEYTVGDPDTLIKSTTNTFVSPAKIPAKMVRGISRTVADVASEAGAGRRGMFERAGRKVDAGTLTKKLFSPESLGGKGRARIADWIVRQSNAIAQPAVNGAVLNVVLGLPDIESAADLGYASGVGAGIGAYGGSRLQERGMSLVDPTTSLSQKIDAIITPDPESLRRDQDADIKRFISTADKSLLSSIDDLSNIENIKSSLDLKIQNLEGKKNAQIRDEDAKRIQNDIDLFKAQRSALDKSNSQTQSEIKRQIQLSFADAMDLAKTTGAAAGLNNVEVKVLRPDQMEQFYRDLYGRTLTDAESVVKQLVGNPRLSPSEQDMLVKAEATIKQYLSDVAGASVARGFAISETEGRPEHLRMQNQKGSTIVINGDLVSQMSRDGLNLSRVINHEMQHALSNFDEVRKLLNPIRKQLFDQKIQNPDGVFEVISKGAISDAELDAYALKYAAGMDSAGGSSFLGQFANQDQVRAYMKEEVLSELAGLSGASHGDLRSGLDSVGRQAVDWIETKTQTGALKKIKDGLRRFGVIVDDQGQFSSVLGANLSPEALAMMRQYQRKLKDLNENLVYNSSPLKDSPEIPLTSLATNRALQERYKHSEFFEQEQVVTLESPDGTKQEVVVPPGTKIDQFVGEYRFANGQLVDEQGNPISLGPDVPLQAMPDGTTVTLDTRIARNPDGSPRILSPRESKRRAKKRGEIIRKAIDDAPDDQSGVRLEDMGNGNYRGTLSPTQIAAINALPNDLVAPSLKRKIAFFNDILGRKDGSIVEIEYQAAMRDGKYRALQPQLRTEIPIGFQFDKQGNFLMTTMSLSRMHDKANAWAAKRPRNLRLWGGDMTKFWDSVRQYLLNHKQGLQGHIGLHSDPEVAIQMKNRINDLFNVYRKETREANPERTTLPKRRGQDPMDVVIRSRRMDRINSFDETALPKMPFQYELAVQNYLPSENPFAEYMTAEEFAKGMEVDQALVNRAVSGDIDPLQLELSDQDLLRPAEYIDVRDGKIRVRSMFDPTQAVFEPGESNIESPAQMQFLPAEQIEAPSGERGFQSKLQMEIQRKFKGAMATPEQLKAVINNPQNVKSEEVKWSGVNDEIDRLAAENNGKVPKDQLLQYLQNEGQVKFNEVTLGGVTKTWTQQEIDALERQAQRTGNWNAYEQAVLEFEDQQLGSDANQSGNFTKYAKLQLPGGTNYREVVLTVPRKTLQPTDAEVKEYYGLLARKEDLIGDELNRYNELLKKIDASNKEVQNDVYYSSHFKDIPNYVAHMRLNERTDTEGNPGLFLEELQSDRHQKARERGYISDQEAKLNEAKKEYEKLAIQNVRGKLNDQEKARLNELRPIVSGQGSTVPGIPDAPFRKDWGVQLFKRALRDAVESGKKWIGWTDGETQADRYNLSKYIDRIDYSVDEDGMYSASAVKGNNEVFSKENMELPEVIETFGKEMADKMQSNAGKRKETDEGMEYRTLSGLDLKVGGEGMKGFYDQILPKEIGRYVSKMGGKVEKSEIETPKSKKSPDYMTDAELLQELKRFSNAVPIWRVNITPEMERVVRAGQVQFMPAEIDAIYSDLEAKAKAGDKEAEAEAQRMVDEAAKKAGYNIRGFHGMTNSELRNNIFDSEDAPYRGGLVAFFSKNRKFAEGYAQNEGKVIEANLKLENPLDFRDKKSIKYAVSDFYSETGGITEPHDIHRLEIGDGKDADASNEYAEYPSELFEQALLEGRWDAFEATEFAKWVNQQGYDGIVMKENDSITFAVYDPNQIKSADPFTYDDAGNLIPLSERFQTASPDIRFMPAEQGAMPEPEGLQGIELPTKYRRISDMIPPLRDIEPPIPVQALPPQQLPEVKEPEERKPKKFVFSLTTVSDRVKLVDDLVKEKNWKAIKDLNQATIRHAFSDIPNLKYQIKDVVGAFENSREISASVEVEPKDMAELAEVRKRMVATGELWDQTEVLEEMVGQGDQNMIGQFDNEGYLHTGKFELEFEKLTDKMAENARKASGIQAMTIDGNRVIFYDTDNNPAEFERRVDRYREFVTESGGVLGRSEADFAKIRSYRDPRSPKEGSFYYTEDAVRVLGGETPDRLRSPIFRVVSELLGRPLPSPKDGRSSYFVASDVTPEQVKLQNKIGNAQDRVILNDKNNKDVIRAYEELNGELLKQYDALVASGMEFKSVKDYEEQNALYKNSADVIADIRNNHRLTYLKTAPETFGPQQKGKPLDFSFHPLLRDTGRVDASGRSMNYNDILRCVHDAIAHGIFSAQFGPIGEESAWHTHIRTIDNPWARWALTMETRAQNSWVNYRDARIDPKTKMPYKKGDEKYVPIGNRDFAEQKFALIPLKYTLTGDSKIDAPVKKLIEEIGPKRANGSQEKPYEWMPSPKKQKEILAKVKQPPGAPKQLYAEAKDFLGKPTRKDQAESVPVMAVKDWVEKKTKSKDAAEAGESDLEEIVVGQAALKDVISYQLTNMPLVVQPLPNYMAENAKTKVTKSVLNIASDPVKYKAYTDRVVAASDKILKDPERFTTLSGFLEFMRDSGASGDMLMPPSQLVQLVKKPTDIIELWNGGYHGKKTIPGTVQAAMSGLDGVNEMRSLFVDPATGMNQGPTPLIVALHHFWGILSRQLDPLNQEGMWMRLVSDPRILEQIDNSLNGKYTLELEDWSKLVASSRKETRGDYQKIGNNAASNANAYHKMLERHNGRWQELADIYKTDDPIKMTNDFWGLGVGPTGIKNKVQRFIGLTFGIHGSVLDRWRFVSLNLPMAMKLRNSTTPDTFFNYYGKNKTIPEDPVGIYKVYGTIENGNPVYSTALYAGIDRAIQGVINNSSEMKKFLGIHATPGGFHWVDWNCVKNEAVGHSSLDLTKDFYKQKGRAGTVQDFLDVVKNSMVYTRADQDGKILDLIMDKGVFRVETK